MTAKEARELAESNIKHQKELDVVFEKIKETAEKGNTFCKIGVISQINKKKLIDKGYYFSGQLETIIHW